MLRDLYHSDNSWSIALLRYFNPIGAHESGLIGEDPNGIPNNIMPRLINVALGKMDSMTVFGDDYPTRDGTGVRDYIHVVDLAKGHVAAIAKVRSQTMCDAYNLGTGKGYSVLEIIHGLEKACGKKLPYHVTPRRAGDIAECYADPVSYTHLTNDDTKHFSFLRLFILCHRCILCLQIYLQIKKYGSML